MEVKLGNNKLNGEIQAISSKSDLHRLIICAALAENSTYITFNQTSIDIDATLSCVKQLGADFKKDDTEVIINPIRKREKVVLDCVESGSTLRFLVPIAAVVSNETSFYGAQGLRRRPLTPLTDEMQKFGCNCEYGTQPNTPIVKISGKLRNGIFNIAGDISSQFISGLLFALAVVEGTSEIIVTSKLESAAYVEMTLSTMRRFGVVIHHENLQHFIVHGGQKYRAHGELQAEGDWSNAAFWLCANALGSSVKCTGLNQNSAQGDSQIASLLSQKGDIEIDAAQIPDLIPILTIFATARDGTTKIVNAARLRIKESDRLHSISQCVKNLGGEVTELEDGLIIPGKQVLSGGVVDGFNDHRIVMSAAIAATVCQNPVVIRDAQAVEKSYPKFFEHYRELGGMVDVL